MSDAKARLLVAALVSVTIALEVAAVALAFGVASHRAAVQQGPRVAQPEKPRLRAPVRII